MRYIFLFILFGINYTVFSQSISFFYLGQRAPSDKNACLVIKNKSKPLTRIDQYIPSYQNITRLKLIGFNSENYHVDSVLKKIKQLINVKDLIFENCDLTELETSFSNFKNLEKISIIKQSVIYENTFFYLLKDNPVKQLFIQTNDPELALDSIYLLSELEQICISSNASFLNTNYNKTIKFNENGKVMQIEMAYFGDFYKANKRKITSNNTIKKEKSETVFYQANPYCIKQPIPGIKINDTLYTLHSTQKTEFTYRSGSKLNFDANAFVTQSGEKYDGPVKIFYREFRNPVEIMLSGIPMTNTENGETHLFKSGGMYQLNAFDKNNNTLTTVSDTSVKINFVLTDTSQNFKFYSLNNNGSWATTSNNVTVTGNSQKCTDAVKEYYQYIKKISRIRTDTTKYEFRFHNNDYLYKYRKDNFSFYDTVNSPSEKLKLKKELNEKANFRIKYVRLTKDKEILFTVIPVNKRMFAPAYISLLFNKTYLYTGGLTKDQFKKTYNRKNIFWDLRTVSNDNVINMEIKGLYSIHELSGQIIYLKKDKTYSIPKKQGKIVNQRIARLLKREAKNFNKNENLSGWDHNKINLYTNRNKEKLAYQHSLKYQNDTEKKMNYEEWEKYVLTFSSYFNTLNDPNYNNELGTALLKSGLGVKNIDCYIHSGQMQNVIVRYKDQPYDTISSQYNAFLYTAINTSFPMYAMGEGGGGLSGYYFKNNQNYIVRFSNEGIMQVTKPNTVSNNKKSKEISLEYLNQFNIKGMDSNAITKLILN